MKTLLISMLTLVAAWSIAGWSTPLTYEVHAMEAESNPSPSSMLGRVAYSSWGVLALAHEDGVVRLRGLLDGSGGCGYWSSDVSRYENPDIVVFELTPQTDNRLCLQATSEKEVVGAGIRATGNEFFIIKVAGEIIFAGRLEDRLPSLVI
jgi:hypothetical protein